MFCQLQKEQESYKLLQENEEKLMSTAFYKLVSKLRVYLLPCYTSFLYYCIKYLHYLNESVLYICLIFNFDVTYFFNDSFKFSMC